MKYEPTNFYTHDEETKTLKDWAADIGAPSRTLQNRLNRGWPLERVLTSPSKAKVDTIEINGLVLPPRTWISYLNITHQALYKAAIAHNLTPAEEIKSRFRKKPHLFPHHLLEKQGE